MYLSPQIRLNVFDETLRFYNYTGTPHLQISRPCFLRLSVPGLYIKNVGMCVRKRRPGHARNEARERARKGVAGAGVGCGFSGLR